MDFEEPLGRFPILAFAAHPFAENARVQLAFPRFFDSIQDAVSFGGQLGVQALLKVRSNAAR